MGLLTVTVGGLAAGAAVGLCRHSGALSNTSSKLLLSKPAAGRLMSTPLSNGARKVLNGFTKPRGTVGGLTSLGRLGRDLAVFLNRFQEGFVGFFTLGLCDVDFTNAPQLLNGAETP